MTVEYLDLADFLVIAEEVTGMEVETLMRMSRLHLADSALHAPAAAGELDEGGAAAWLREFLAGPTTA